MRKILGLFCLVSFPLSIVLAHGDNSHFPQQADPTVKTTKIAGNIYLLQGRGGNVGASAGADGILIVDDDYQQMSVKLAAALKELGSEKPRFVFNTHWHGDHTQGNLFFGKDSIIIAHTNVRKRLSQDNTVFGEVTKAYPSYAWPIVTYTKDMSVHFNGEEIKAVYYPNGHTDGDTVIFFTGSNVVHLGDDFFVARFPFVDLDSGGSVQGLINNVASLMAEIRPDAKLIPGHGPISTLDDLKAYHAMLTDTSKMVQDAMKKKKTLDEIKKAGFPEKYESWGSGFIKTDFWIETIYKSYSKK
jgi:glyoxylase-like metal-dependent hydrolase (beta-lactamase superfamily II)